MLTAKQARRQAQPTVAGQMFGAALDLLGRLGLVTILGGIGTLAITRLLGPTGYGSYASAVATAAILGAASDLGFTVMLSRDAAGAPAMHRPMLRAAYEVATAWSLILTLVLVALAVSAGLTTDRGLVLLVLAPSMAFNGLNPARPFLIITGRTRSLLVIDVLIMVCQIAASVAVAVAGLGPVAVGVTVSAGSIIDNIAVSLFVGRRLVPGDERRFSRKLLLWRSAPLGLASILTRVYLTVDLVLLGWLISGPRLGQYAAAAKAVTILAGVSGTVMSGVLPTLSRKAAVRHELDELIGRIWHWLVVGPLPAFVALLLFAGPVIRVALGHRYAGAAPLMQILALAGCISVLSNLAGTLMVVFRHNRAMVLQNTAAIVFNVAGNLILIPRFGVLAAAWMTVATEALVCAASLIRLRDQISLVPLAAVSLRPSIALAVAVLVALALHGFTALSIACSALAFPVVLSLLRGWPPEFGRLPSSASVPVEKGTS